MAVKNGKCRITFSTDKAMEDFLRERSEVEVRSLSNLIHLALLEKYNDEYREYISTLETE